MLLFIFCVFFHRLNGFSDFHIIFQPPIDAVDFLDVLIDRSSVRTHAMLFQETNYVKSVRRIVFISVFEKVLQYNIGFILLKKLFASLAQALRQIFICLALRLFNVLIACHDVSLLSLQNCITLPMKIPSCPRVRVLFFLGFWLLECTKKAKMQNPTSSPRLLFYLNTKPEVFASSYRLHRYWRGTLHGAAPILLLSCTTKFSDQYWMYQT